MTECRISIDGKLTPSGEARVSVLDRGFLYGDSVYEVLRTYSGRPWALAEHLERLQRSATLVGMTIPQPLDRLAQEVADVVSTAAYPEAYLRIIVTRGEGPISLDPTTATTPRRIIICAPLNPLSESAYSRGIKVTLVDGGGVPVGIPAGVKSGNYLPNVLAMGQARGRDAHEALRCDASGWVTEGTSSNVFAVFGAALTTPPLEAGILDGITRRQTIAIARRKGLIVVEDPLHQRDLRDADEIFLTSTLRQILPVTRVDDWTVSKGRPGPITLKLLDQFRRLTGSRPGRSPQGCGR